MPFRAPTVCPVCRRQVASGVRCPCRPPTPRTADPRNAERALPYNSPEWKALRSEHLKANRTCVKCGARASVVDHVKPWRGDRRLFLDPSNLQSLCRPCHSRKTSAEDGGFGNPIAAPKGCDAAGNPIDPSHPWFRQ